MEAEHDTLVLVEHPHVLLGYVKRFQIRPQQDEPYIDSNQFFQDANDLIINVVHSQLRTFDALKLQLRLRVKFVQATDETATADAFFNSAQQRIMQSTPLSDVLLQMYDGIADKIEHYQSLGSGWVVDIIVYCDIHVAKYEPLAAASYIPLPRSLFNRKAIVNIQNADNMCFVWCILAALHPARQNAARPTHYRRYLNELDISQLKFPVSIDQIEAFEIANQISVNVFQFVNSTQVVYFSKLAPNQAKSQVNLLRLEQNDNSHYCLIRDLNRFLASETKNEHRKYFCSRCLAHFSSEDKLQTHCASCFVTDAPQLCKMPPADKSKLKFDFWTKCLRQPLVVYADFECLLKKEQSCAQQPTVSYTRTIQHHEVCSFALLPILQCCGASTRSKRSLVLGRNQSAVTQFLSSFLTIAKQYQEQIDSSKPLLMTNMEWQQFHRTTHCHICRNEFSSCCSNSCTQTMLCMMCRRQRVRDHCHVCGKYRGAAHSSCNLAFRLNRDIVVVFHNLRRYDGHLIMQKIGDVANSHGLTLTCIPKGMEDYLTFSLHVPHQFKNVQKQTFYKIRFIDSFQFLSTSLDNLVNSLAKSGCFNCLEEQFPNSNDRQLLLQKGIYPYDYMDSWDKFDETSLPTKDKFYNSLTNSELSDLDCGHAQQVWQHFRMSDLGEYHDVYLKTDVLLLADVFENFRSFALEQYRLDPAKYFTLPSFSWDAWLLFTGVCLDLILDEKMYEFFEGGIRGGISVISHMHAVANNPYLDHFDANKPITYIIYMDANNLYGWSMTQPLPVSNFAWLSELECSSINLNAIDDDATEGYVLEVDLEYPSECHEEHSSYPVAPEQLCITSNMISGYSKELRERLQMKKDHKVVKLAPNLLSKKNYVVHYRNLKLYLKLGLKLTKVHRNVRFTQRSWMKPYIQFNAEMRKAAHSNFEKDLFKLLNNAVFGKSMENVRNYVDVKLATKPSQLRKLIANPLFESCVEFSENLAAVKLSRSCVLLNMPIYTGFAVLDLSKLLMYDFHYNHMVRTYGHNQRLLFTDTDSLAYEVTTEDIYKDMEQTKHLYDTSDYPTNHFLFSLENKKKLGLMKDETFGVPIAEFVGLRAKMYSILYQKEQKKRAKGVAKAIVRNELLHSDFKQTLLTGQLMRHRMKSFRTHLHHIRTVEMNKISLSAYDDKRYILSDGITTLAYGHVGIDSYNL